MVQLMIKIVMPDVPVGGDEDYYIIKKNSFHRER